MGSWRPTEAPRDFPWKPTPAETAAIRELLDLDGLIGVGGVGFYPTRPSELCAPPAAGRVSHIDQGERS
jgi:hypothetical protein